MRHALYGSNAAQASVAILVKEAAFDTDKVKKAYIDELGANPAGFVAYSLWYDDSNKCPAALAKDYLKDVLHSVKSLGIQTILIADSRYFKYLTKEQKPAHDFLGCAVKSKIEDYEDAFTVFYVPNYQSAKYNPRTAQEMEIGLEAFKGYLTGNYVKPGENVVHSAKYPQTLQEIKAALDWLLTKEALTVDIEAKSLKFWKAGIATIAFAWDQHNFIAIPVDRGEFILGVDEVFTQLKSLGIENSCTPFNVYVKHLLREFFEAYTGKLIAHNANYDFKVLTFELWMQHFQDVPGMIHGIQTLTRDFDDTRVITYLATNNAVENVLGLKPLVAEFLGNYAEDTSDTTKIPLPDLLLYNGKDCLGTWFVRDKYQPKMIADDQRTIYEELFKPSVITLLATELTGMPIYPDAVARAKHTLTKLSEGYQTVLQLSTLVQEFQLEVKAKKCQEFTEAAKKKIFTMDDPRVQRLEFNPNSGQQVADLLYNYLGLPILDLTDTNQPATGIKTLKKLVNHTQNPAYLEIINALIDLSQVDKILTSFIPAFEENSVQMPDGSWRLFGNFNLGGTVSGRLSCVAPWTPIVTNRGEIPIYQVKVGDLVHTHKGNWKPVSKTIYKGLDYMVDVRLSNGKVFTCTTDHKVLMSSGTWKTIKEIMNVCIQDLDEQPRKCGTNCRSLSFIEERHDNGRDCQKVGNNFSQCLSCAANAPQQRRIADNQTSEILSVENRGQKPHERQEWKPASQLEGRVFGQQRLSDDNLEWKENLCAPCSHDGTFEFDRPSRKHGGASYRQQSTEQCLRQSCLDYQSRAQRDSLFAGNGFPAVEIQEINYRGSTPVYDLTVQDDASYLSCGFYSHNSSDPNLQNIPSHSTWAKLIKECFGCAGDWLFGGADFNSLEDMVSALTTRDPNKMKVYLDGYDGHSMRAYTYFKDQMPDITDTVTSINSIAKLYPDLRQRSKTPTFLLTYQGTYHGLMNSLGLSQDEAMRIEAGYHELYKASDQWVAERIQQACTDGYVTGAFGLRLRTPLLKMNGPGKLHYKAAAEGRTAGNMLGQSYGMLNSRAANEFRERVWASKYRYDILLCGQIHDALYVIWRNTVSITKWVNDNIIDCMEWDGLVELRHPTVKVGAELDIFYPDWAHATTIKNKMSGQDIFDLCKLP